MKFENLLLNQKDTKQSFKDKFVNKYNRAYD